ncbi:MAG: trypsin-like peptidase domain-containing protein [Rhodospirillales bacterium]|nr:trypsin-like peptidase domain-containing protein [Rhodospirillales bacterium]
MPHLLLLLLAAAALGGCASVSVFGIVGDEDDLYTGSATGYLDRSGTIELKNAAGNRCSGDFVYGVGLTGRGLIACDDGQRAAISFTGLSPMSGFGSGTSSSGRPVAFTYGLSREQSARYLGFKATAPGAVTAAVPGNAAPPAAAKRVGTGTGFYINRQGHLLTNAHVIAKCRELTISRQGAAPVPASVVKSDASNDLAVLIATPSPAVATFRAGRPVRAGEAVVAYGFPLTGTLSSGGVVTNGSISALSGIRDDSRYLQISAPIQGGNSGGPLLDTAGNVVGVITASLGSRSRDVPQNVNFALKADVARTFLEAAGVPIETSGSSRELSVADVGEKARAFSVLIDCKR